MDPGPPGRGQTIHPPPPGPKGRPCGQGIRPIPRLLPAPPGRFPGPVSDSGPRQHGPTERPEKAAPGSRGCRQRPALHPGTTQSPLDRGFDVVEVVGVEPTSKTCRMAALPQAWSALGASRRGADEPRGTLAPGSRPPSGGVAAAHLVPQSGRPKPPIPRFNEPGTQRSRGLARHLGCPRRRGPVRSYRWQFDLGGLMRGPAVQPPPAPGTRIHDLSKPVTPVALMAHAIRSPQGRGRGTPSMEPRPDDHKGTSRFGWATARLRPSAKRQGRAWSSGEA